jgi:predicted RNase H-like HicB family nuclease
MELDLGYFQRIYFNVATEFQNTAECMREPSVMYKPTLSQDGNKWLAIYGDLPTGVVGVGNSPEEAMRDFNRAWTASITTAA